MKRYILCTFLLSFVGFALMFGQKPKQYFKVGEEFRTNQKYSDAIEQYTKAIDLEPDYIKAFEARAGLYEATLDYIRAAEDYEKLCIFDKKNEVYSYNAARMYYIQQEYAKTLDKLDIALEIKRFYVEAQQLKVNTLIELERYSEALEMAKEALRYKESDVNYYNYGRVNELSDLQDKAEEAYQDAIKKNKDFVEPRLALSDLQRRRMNLTSALKIVNEVIETNKNNVTAYKIRSAIFADQLKYAEAINDISTILILEPENESMYMLRGKYYQGYAQHMNAISDFSKAISLNNMNADAYYNRGYSYEQILKFDEAIKDYKRLSEIAENDKRAKELLVEAESRLFELNRESDKPELKIVNPLQSDENTLKIPRSTNVVPIVGSVKDESEISEIRVNNLSVPFTLKKDSYEFMTSINLSDRDGVLIEVKDIYDNSTVVDYIVIRTEIDPPQIRIIAPYASDNNLIYLDNNEPTLYIEGAIVDESLIKAIYINDIIASYVPDDKNPNFQAMLNIQNKDKFTVKAEDAFGNISEAVFTLNRESANLNADNPMGKTWVVFVENSNYNSFASLEGPTKDITLMKTALSKYNVHNFIHKKDMSKQDLERFFAIELRDLLRSNRVNSLLVWYAGHGKFVNETGYWVPIDAKRDDEFTYFNINALKASMQSYSSNITHTLVITDACESGPSFYQAMRSEIQEKNCNDWSVIKLKSSQVFSSAGYELAVDNSQFTRTFANILANNPDACIPIESVVLKVTDAVVKSNQQKPQFGKIAGLEDENGTFFFIAK